MRHKRLIECVVPNWSFCRGASPGQLAIIAKQCWTLEARRGDTIARRDVRLAELADR
jgi:hypothetical protein